MALILSLIGAVLFTMLFIAIVIGARSLFDAAWILAIFSIPASTLADISARLMGSIIFDEHGNIYLDLGMLYLFGILQYGLIGFLVGKCLLLFRLRRKKSCN